MRDRDRWAAVMDDIAAANADDPRRIMIGGIEKGYEPVYAERMAATLAALYPDASDLLRLAAQAQHIRRWEIPRENYPKGRAGYERWRRAARAHHVAVISAILERHGYGADEIAHVAKLIRKDALKHDPESQALEDVVGLVFIEHYLDEFLAKYQSFDRPRLLEILSKTLRKMSPKGCQAARALPLRQDLHVLIADALAGANPQKDP